MTKVKINSTDQIAFIKSHKTDDLGGGNVYALVDSQSKVVWNGDFLNWPESLVTVLK